MSALAPGHEDLPALARRVVHEAAMALVAYTPGDDHTEPASRAASIAVLRVLVADTRSRLTPGKRAHLSVLVEQIRRDAPSPSQGGGTDG